MSLLAFCIEFLVSIEVKHIFVATRHPPAKLDKFIKTVALEGVEVSVLHLESAQYAGDALRDIEQQDLIKGDFVLMRANVVARFFEQGPANMKRALAEHFTRAADPDVPAIVTKVLVAVRTND